MINNLKSFKPYLIAEIGINHNGSINLAKKLILLAKKYNFDFVKFQKRNPDICVPKNQRDIKRETPWGTLTYFNYKKKIEFNIKQYKLIDQFCKKVKIKWFASSWDEDSQKQMRIFNFSINKIASAMITNLKFLELVASEKKITLISTGMCSMKDIKTAVKIFKSKKCPFILMHCVSTYPCPEDKLNLNLIPKLKKIFNCQVGYSGHESTVSPSIIATMLGAKIIERHITLDRSMWGTDQAASLSEEGIKNLSNVIKKIPEILGNGIKKFNNEEKKTALKFRYWDDK
jgi:N-acetylneuraminate synthase